MKLIIVSLTISLAVFLYFFTNHHPTKKTLEIDKPPKKNRTPRTEKPLQKEEITEEKKRLPDVVIIGVKKSGTMTLGRGEGRCEVIYLRPALSPRQVPQASPQHCGGR